MVEFLKRTMSVVEEEEEVGSWIAWLNLGISPEIGQNELKNISGGDQIVSKQEVEAKPEVPSAVRELWHLVRACNPTTLSSFDGNLNYFSFIFVWGVKNKNDFKKGGLIQFDYSLRITLLLRTEEDYLYKRMSILSLAGQGLPDVVF